MSTLNAVTQIKKSNKRFIKSVMVLAVAHLLFTMCGNKAVYASIPAEHEQNINLQINASWGGGDILNLDITDLETGERQQVAIRLSDFIHEDENARYILLQAMDLPGERQSGVIQIENPLFDPDKVQVGSTVANSGSSLTVDELPEDIQNIVAEANQTTPPTLTPDGTGTVLDNIMTVNDIEFFTVTTENGSDFFLVVDRQRTSNNVYLLNTVTEADLMSLAEARGETLMSVPSNNTSAAQPQETPAPAPTMEEILQAIQESTEQGQEQPSLTPTPVTQGNNSGIIFLVVILVVIVGGIFAVWKFVLPMLNKTGQSSQEEIEDDEDFDNEHDLDDEDGGDDSGSFDSVEVDDDEGEETYEGGEDGDESYP